ncbi:beta-glucuronidase [Galactobacillus timonensis]|uniref:beta-glucuronidase n=1 Tax=Galactobacillus timonensis TaxID=2041840 RepID=UPI000C836E04|nr:beta-glucuronidase [Galactobacillus timonensis]
MGVSELYPVVNSTRSFFALDGMWDFRFDPESIGKKEGWAVALPSPIPMPVPASFADFFTDAVDRDYCGDFWYAKDFFLNQYEEGKRIILRFGSVTHRCTVYVNGVEAGSHEGGFLPVVLDVTDLVKYGERNHIAVWANNELSETTLPCGTVKVRKDGRKIAKPYFDFFNYSGIHRSVHVLSIPKESILDFDTRYELKGDDAVVHYSIRTNGTNPVTVKLLDREGNQVAYSEGNEGSLFVANAHLWKVRNAYLYRLVMTIHGDAGIIDSYESRIGIRTVRIEGTQILINEEPVYLKGYGKHEDFDILGRGFSWAVAKRDFECMKWTNANCFRTSHYPYAEEWYQMADEEGFLIIDEVPAVGMMRSTHNFIAAGMGGYTSFFETPTVPQLLANHKAQVEEMIIRDKNHPSVITFSLFNEPETISEYAYNYFKEVFEWARTLDPQHRPLTGAFEKNSKPELCQVYPLVDIVCMNRYYGWYINGGASEMDEAEELFRDEMDRWAAKGLNKPFVFTEFGTDTLGSEHKLPSVMWTQEYQNEYYAMNFRVFDSYPFVQGELTWNFADFQTSEGVFRVNGNKKGVFTRQRQPKDAAFTLKKRWETK